MDVPSQLQKCLERVRTEFAEVLPNGRNLIPSNCSHLDRVFFDGGPSANLLVGNTL